jgi:8-oxo-dGTP pyrophosphatase MutT (NUDIX family)
MERQRSAGGVVVRTEGGVERFLLISLRDGRRWQLPKGHPEGNETASQAAVREVREETGVTGRPLAELGSIAYRFVEAGTRIHKRVDFFLLAYVHGSTDDYDPREVSGAHWFPWDEGLARLTFDNERDIARAARRRWRRRARRDPRREETP